LRSRVWFTVALGNLSEVYFPAVDRPVLHGLRFLVAAGGSPPIDDAAEADHEVRWLEPGVPAFRVVSRHAEYTLQKEFVVDPESNALLLAVTFRPEMPDLHLYIQATTHGLADGYVLGTEPPSLFANHEGSWVSVVGPFKRGTVGYLNSSDLFVDLHDNDGVMTAEYGTAEAGSVALGAEIGIREGSFQLALGFADEPEAAEDVAHDALDRGVRRVREALIEAWRLELELERNVLRVAGDGGALAQCSFTLLRCLEDKDRRGAFIAAPTAPWGLPEQTYTRVWNRDLFHIASVLQDAGDAGAARRALSHLERTQGEDGSWPQNPTVTGQPQWTGEELDQVAFPILLAWRLLAAQDLDHDPWPTLVSRAATRLLVRGPATQLDRWEDAGGLSPSTLAVAVAALMVAAEFADRAQVPEAAEHLRAVADYWNDAIERWTYLPSAQHYVRLSSDPDRGPQAHQHVVGVEFLELVRRGLRRPDDPRIRSSLAAADAVLRMEVPGGPAWRRYVGDRYGESENGWNWAPERPGCGRAWPVLAAERAFYELALGIPVAASVRSLESWAGPELILPEQLWDEADLPAAGLEKGRPTGSAAPLGWAHAEYLGLLIAIATAHLPDIVEPARLRYIGRPPASPALVWSHAHQFETFPAGRVVRIQLPAPAAVEWTADGWTTSRLEEARDTRLGVWVADLPVQHLGQQETVHWTVRYADGTREDGYRSLTVVRAQTS
jgi:glucoamylase